MKFYMIKCQYFSIAVDPMPTTYPITSPISPAITIDGSDRHNLFSPMLLICFLPAKFPLRVFSHLEL